MNGRERVRQLAAKLAKVGSREVKGDFGESRALEWFEYLGVDYYRWPQSRELMPPSLARLGGKRPDFAVDLAGEMIYFDAKFHSTSELTEFSLEDEELQKFIIFKDWVHKVYGDEGTRDVIFILYPQELNGERFILILLEELLGGTQTVVRGKPGRSISLSERDDLWFDQP